MACFPINRIEDIAPIPFAALHEEDLNGDVGPGPICEKRWTDQPEPDLIVVGEIGSTVPDARRCGDALEGRDQFIENLLGHHDAEGAIHVLEDSAYAGPGLRGDPVVSHSALLLRAA